jgi:hypothetical protein
MKALKVFEKFTEDSDPIHDMEIGVGVDFEKKANQTIRNETYDGTTDWLTYLKSLIGKRITGRFERQLKPSTFIIKDYSSYHRGTTLVFISNTNTTYTVDKNERYYIH